MILVDTSAWIEFFRGRGPLAAAVDRALLDDEVALCGPVETELRRGLSRPTDRSKVLPLLAGCHVLPQPARLWEEAGDLGSLLARKGATVKSLDLLIATYALVHGVAVMTRDSDFRRIRDAGVVRLQIIGD